MINGRSWSRAHYVRPIFCHITTSGGRSEEHLKERMVDAERREGERSLGKGGCCSLSRHISDRQSLSHLLALLPFPKVSRLLEMV